MLVADPDEPARRLNEHVDKVIGAGPAEPEQFWTRDLYDSPQRCSCGASVVAWIDPADGTPWVMCRSCDQAPTSNR